MLLLLLLLMSVPLVSNLRNHCQIQYYEDFSSFSSEFSCSLHVNLSSNLSWLLYMVLSKGATLFFICEYPVFSESFVEKTVLSPLNGLCTLVKNHLVTNTSVHFWGFYSIPLIRVSVFMTVPQCFDYHIFTVSFEIKNCEFSSFVFLFQEYFDYLRFLEIPYEF